jgi:hypothetical protein
VRAAGTSEIAASAAACRQAHERGSRDGQPRDYYDELTEYANTHASKTDSTNEDTIVRTSATSPK